MLLKLVVLLFSYLLYKPIVAPGVGEPTISTEALIESRQSAMRQLGSCQSTPSEKEIFNFVKNHYENTTKNLYDQTEPVIVTVEMHIQEISNLQAQSSDFEVDVMFSQTWHDPGLNLSDYDFCQDSWMIDKRILDHIWTPQLCFINSKHARIHNSPVENVFVTLTRNGSVWANWRIKIIAPCNMNFELFPFDSQTCQIEIESYGYSRTRVQLRWYSKQPAILLKPMKFPEFQLSGFKAGKTVYEYSNGDWDRLIGEFWFRRHNVYYMLQAYIPTFLIIIISWSSFVMEPRALPARTTVTVSCMVALIFLFGASLSHLPPVSYVKAIDIWMLSCVTFLFLNMVELSLVCVAGRVIARKARSRQRRIQRQHQAVVCMGNKLALNGTDKTRVDRTGVDASGESFPMLSPNTDCRNSHRYSMDNMITQAADAQALEIQERIDHVACVLFPLSFIIFNGIYWSYYLSESVSSIDSGFSDLPIMKKKLPDIGEFH